MRSPSTYLVFGATGRTGRPFVALALEQGHHVRALVRDPRKVTAPGPNFEVVEGSISDYPHLDELVTGVDFVVLMMGDARQQQVTKMNTEFLGRLVPAMRRQGVKRLLYQAGGFTSPYHKRLPLVTRWLKRLFAGRQGLGGQHEDNEAVIEYLVEECSDVEWMVHRAAIIADGPSKGTLQRSPNRTSLATFGDCADYNYRLLHDATAIHTYDLSFYQRHRGRR